MVLSVCFALILLLLVLRNPPYRGGVTVLSGSPPLDVRFRETR